MKSIIISIIFVTLLSCSVQEPIKYRSIELQEFTGGQLSKVIPISFDIPENYAKIEISPTADVSVYWMPRDKFEKVEESGDLPVDSGHIWGRISQDVAYNSRENKFSNEDTVIKIHENFGFDVKDLKVHQRLL